jgi:hypothetical protein
LIGGHVALEDVDAALLIERDASHIVEADHVVLADQAALAFACTSGSQLNKIEVALHKGSHAEQHHHLGPLTQCGWFHAD